MSTTDMLNTVGEARTNSWVLFSYEFLPMDIPVLATQQVLTYINSVQTLDAV